MGVDLGVTTSKDRVTTSAQYVGIVSIPANYTVDETVIASHSDPRGQDAKLFAVISHSGEAETAGLHVPPTRVMIFGNPQAGTPLILAAPTVAIDLLLKLLIAQNADGFITISYNSSEYLRLRHHIPEELLGNIAVVEALARQVAE